MSKIDIFPTPLLFRLKFGVDSHLGSAERGKARLIIREIIFAEFQPQTDGENGQTTQSCPGSRPTAETALVKKSLPRRTSTPQSVSGPWLSVVQFQSPHYCNCGCRVDELSKWAEMLLSCEEFGRMLVRILVNPSLLTKPSAHFQILSTAWERGGALSSFERSSAVTCNTTKLT